MEPRSYVGRRWTVGLLVPGILLLGSCSKVKPPEPAPSKPVQKPAAVKPIKPNRQTLFGLQNSLSRMKTPSGMGKASGSADVAAEVVADYLETPGKLNHPREFELVAQIVESSKVEGTRSRLAQQWLAKFVSDDSHRYAMNASQLLELGALLKTAGRAGETCQVAQFALSQLMDEQWKRKKLPYTELWDLNELSRMSGIDDLGREARRRMEGLPEKGAFPKDLAPFEIDHIAHSCGLADDREGRTRLADFVVDDYLPQEGLTRVLGFDDWGNLTALVLEHGSKVPGVLNLIDQAVENGEFSTDRWMRPQVAQFAAQLSKLGDKGPVRVALVRHWLGLADQWEALDSETRGLIVDAVVDMGAERERLKVLEERFTAREASPGLNVAEYQAICQLSDSLRAILIERRWARKAFERFVRSGSRSLAPDRLAALADILTHGEHLGGDDAVAYVKLLVQSDPNGADVPDSLYADAAEALAGDSGREALEAALLDPDGRIQLVTAKLLAWTYHNKRKIREFQERIGAMMNGPSVTADDKALAELVLGYCAGLGNERVPLRTRGYSFMDKALGDAQSDEMAMRCLGELVAIAEIHRDYLHAIKAIDSCRDRIGGAYQGKLETIRDDLNRKLEAKQAEQANPRPRWGLLFAHKAIQDGREAGGFVSRQ